MKVPLRFLALDLFPIDAESEWSSAAAEVHLISAPTEAVGTVRRWLCEQGWHTNRVLRHRASSPEDWPSDSDGRRWAELALSGRPQVHTGHVLEEMWSLASGRAVSEDSVTLADFAAALRDNGGWWLKSEQGVASLTSPGGETVFPLWLRSSPPVGWTSDGGALVPVELESLLDNILLEVDQYGDLIGLGAGDLLRTVHPARLRRSLLWELD